MANLLFETYKSLDMPHSNHMFKTVYDMAMEAMCAYPLSKYVFTKLEICVMLLCSISMD